MMEQQISKLGEAIRVVLDNLVGATEYKELEQAANCVQAIVERAG